MKTSPFRSLITKRFLFAFIVLFSFSLPFASRAGNTPGSSNGLPCTDGPDYRGHMVGAFAIRLSRMDDTGPDIRYSPGFDAMWLAQCINPSGSGALQQLFDALKADEQSGIMTKCSPTDDISFDKKGNIQLCSDEADSYVGLAGENWTWDYYCAQDNSCPSGGGGGDGSNTPPNPESDGVTALAGNNPGLAFDPAKRLWLVIAENGGKIQGQLMTEANKPSGKILSIGGSGAETPKVAYGSSMSKYLVTWISGKDPNGILWGQLVNEDGTDSGSAFKIGSGGAAVYPSGGIQFDKKTQRFVIPYEKNSVAVDVMVATVDGSGAVGGPTVIAKGVDGNHSMPSIAINSKLGSYCASYRDSDNLKIVPVASNGTPGTADTVATKTEQNIGIIYNATDGTYLPTWLKNGAVYSKSLSDCSGGGDFQEIQLATEAQTGIIIPNTNGFGLFAVNTNGSSDDFITYDGSFNKVNDQSIFAGTWSASGLPWVAAAANPTTGQFGAAASPDGKNVKFTANIGVKFTGPINNGPIPKGTDLPVPSQGLPTDLAQLIEAIFTWSLSIIGLVIFVRFFYAGFLWFTSAGSPGRISDAKKIMQNVAYGTAVLFSAFLILNTINPDLVHSSFNLPGIPSSVPATTNNGNPPAQTKLYTCDENDQCVIDPQGQYDNSDCDTVCPPPSDTVKLYTCDENDKCVPDPQGQYDNSSCDQVCP